MLVHCVLFQIKESASPEAIKTLGEAFLGMKAHIPAIRSVAWYANTGPAARSQGFNHMLRVTFDGQEELALYATHPHHVSTCQEYLFPLLAKNPQESVVIFDHSGD
ncbi:Dabb family protein [Formicincola oecophyllae]|uniref:Dabb family protein n=1 Tax=Formicincola oecophyllae TaxID=2558361 RepID=A0A4Y6UAD4_9PROT|nr:Dabb family protein [Formicincola oecophyllae]QDH13397.1 Dabb family protein [Formicincola oecophyllae]